MPPLLKYKIGDSLDILKELPSDAFHSCVTDPPYGLSFMGKEWDKFRGAERYERWTENWAREVYRVLRPGGHLLVFGGTRMYHKMVCGVEDAGFEIRDSIMWLYGTGFPKSLDVSKAIDKMKGAEREVVGKKIRGDVEKAKRSGVTMAAAYANRNNKDIFGYGVEDITIPATDAAKEWVGWGTALKPAYEPIVLARKPFKGTVAGNVLEWETGGMNIDGCRIGIDDTDNIHAKNPHTKGGFGHAGAQVYGESEGAPTYTPQGRWPANIILTHHPECVRRGMKCHPDCPIRILDGQSGELKSGKDINPTQGSVKGFFGEDMRYYSKEANYGDVGGASRFFYCAKASRKERELGLGPPLPCLTCKKKPDHKGNHLYNGHPTVKPLKLVQYLVRLITPGDGIVLDPFLGSGTTLIAAHLEGMDAFGIEKEKEYESIIEGRLAYWMKQQRLEE